jgi:hypothetical protein
MAHQDIVNQIIHYVEQRQPKCVLKFKITVADENSSYLGLKYAQKEIYGEIQFAEHRCYIVARGYKSDDLTARRTSRKEKLPQRLRDIFSLILFDDKDRDLNMSTIMGESEFSGLLAVVSASKGKKYYMMIKIDWLNTNWEENVEEYDTGNWYDIHGHMTYSGKCILNRFESIILSYYRGLLDI